ncbi:MAG: FAD-binding protein [Armatimonadetes bacterium]|jgi:glycolate oxidase|nr:FAD-binding protein [Armatimonadota bacterium]
MFSDAIRRELAAIVGAEWFLDRPEDLLAYSYDATPLHQALPDGVVFPASTAEVQAILRLASRAGLKVIPRGSGTNLAAGTVPVEGGLVLVLTRMNQVLAIDEENLTATVQPGAITAPFQAQVEALGLFYPPDPGSIQVSTLGGNVAMCAGGLRGLKYGVTKDYVLGLEAVLPSGEVIRTGGKVMKDVAGYDLTKLLIGSEGTLAVITEILLKLVPKPEAKRTALALFPDLTRAARAVSGIIAARIVPATLEFLDQGTARVVEEYAHAGLPTDVAAVLLIEQDGAPDAVNRDIERIAVICQNTGASEVRVAATPEEAARLMTARRTALAALARVRPTTILEDASVPRAKLAEMVEAIGAISRKYDLQICTFGHAGDGNLHPTCLTDARDSAEIARVEEAFAEIFAVAVDLGGTITGEHGVGAAKAGYLEWRIGEHGIALMKRIKAAFDPQGILNPGKIFAHTTRKRVVVRRSGG